MGIKVALSYCFYRYLALPFRLLPVKKRLVVFQTYFGLNFSDSPSIIAKELFSRKIKGIELVCIVQNDVAKQVPSYIKTVKKHSIQELYYLSRAKVLIDNCRKFKGFVKRKGQYYIQTWHGGIGPKKVEFLAKEKLSPEYMKNAVHDSEIADLFLSGSKWQTDLIRNAFMYYGEVMEAGLPRNDILFDKEKHADISRKVKEFYGIESDRKIALYAPTFRNSHDAKSYDLDYDSVLDALEKHWGGKWVFLVRMHVSAYSVQNKIPYSQRIMNGTLYPEINDIIIASDLIISDYSSSIYDALLMNKKILMYASDIDDYLNERGLCFDHFPFPLSTDNKQLIDSIIHFDFEKELSIQDEFMKTMGVVKNGNATTHVVDRVVDVISK